ncbi:MAG: ankyrin repeat domain-containing protein [Alphaproteobacteria bacterium]|nr:ankyrin repeat domain-containing protein [Alphaproteobacteria bacterium]
MRDDWRKAAIDGDGEVIERLLAEGTDIDCRDRYGQTALMLAALHGREKVLCLLADRGADKDVTAKYGLSALMLAVLNRHSGVAEYLVDAGADTRLRGSGAPGFADKTARQLAEHGGLADLAAHIAAADGADRD